jgi:hypothetical protein
MAEVAAGETRRLAKKQDSAAITKWLQPFRGAAPCTDKCWDALPRFWNEFVPTFMQEKDALHSERRRAEAVQRCAMHILADPRCVWREGLRKPSDPSIYDQLFDETCEPPSEDVSGTIPGQTQAECMSGTDVH